MTDNKNINNILEINRGKPASQASQMIRLLKTQLEEAKSARELLIIERQKAWNRRLNFLNEYKLKLQLQDGEVADAQRAEQANFVQISKLIKAIGEQKIKEI